MVTGLERSTFQLIILTSQTCQGIHKHGTQKDRTISKLMWWNGFRWGLVILQQFIHVLLSYLQILGGGRYV